MTVDVEELPVRIKPVALEMTLEPHVAVVASTATVPEPSEHSESIDSDRQVSRGNENF
jgi:hypothetical protein